jgi:hypothetical protein
MFGDDFESMQARAPVTRYEGFWGARSSYSAERWFSWSLDVYAADCPRVRAAYAHAKNGEEADLDEGSDFISAPASGRIPHAAYLFARFERKSFRWGTAVSFLSQTNQDNQEFPPANGFLTYEVWGVTRDDRRTIVMRIDVRHPRLDALKEARLSKERATGIRADGEAAIKADPAYQLVESCPDDEFRPSLNSVNEWVDSLQFR